jgi:hypothetical protein
VEEEEAGREEVSVWGGCHALRGEVGEDPTQGSTISVR